MSLSDEQTQQLLLHWSGELPESQQQDIDQLLQQSSEARDYVAELNKLQGDIAGISQSGENDDDLVTRAIAQITDPAAQDSSSQHVVFNSDSIAVVANKASWLRTSLLLAAFAASLLIAFTAGRFVPYQASSAQTDLATSNSSASGQQIAAGQNPDSARTLAENTTAHPQQVTEPAGNPIADNKQPTEARRFAQTQTHMRDQIRLTRARLNKHKLRFQNRTRRRKEA